MSDSSAHDWDWKSHDGNICVGIDWHHDGARVLLARRAGDAAEFDAVESTWVLGFDDDRWAPGTPSRRIAIGEGARPKSISCLFPRRVSPDGPLDHRRVLEFGIYNPHDGGRPEIVTLDNDSQAALHHCLVIRHRDKARYCLVDLGNPGKHTFVNRQAVHVCLLSHGDLVQMGSFAFVFSSQSAPARGILQPVDAIQGIGVELQNVVLDKLGPVSLRVNPGEMVAIVGESGSGKSTLARTITSLSGPQSGQVLFDKSEAAHEGPSIRHCLGYVSQADVVPPDLKAREAVRFSAALRELDASEHDVESVLRQVEIPEDDCNATPATLSGGQRKRMRIAAELIARPRLLIMDEPASGLDRNREASLLRLLRTLHHRGCTILVITHNLRTLDWFDRVHVVRKDAETGRGEISYSGTPAELRQLIPSGDLDDLDPSGLSAAVDSTSSGTKPSSLPGVVQPHRERSCWRQFKTLLAREACYLRNSPFKRLVLPLVIVPVIFATAIGLGVRPVDRPLLGFLSILACIWMSASLSVMAIVDERDVYEHERMLFLRNDAYVMSKTVISWILSGLQTSVFAFVLVLCRQLVPHSETRAILYDPIESSLVLVIVGWSAAGAGLFISAAAAHSKPAAALLLPLFMMAQIVFSVLVGDPSAATNPSDADQAYQNYSLAKPASGQSPGLFARAGSYLTLSRYADRALRSFAYAPPSDSRSGVQETPEPPALAESITDLLTLTALFAVATWGCLGLQNRWPSIRRRFHGFSVRSFLAAGRSDAATSKATSANS
jgi:ABC transport system ATP-binding/permease protein